MILWFVYLLINENGRTYIGATTNYERRLRQHNKELVGGARSTSNHGPWKMVRILAGFRTKSEAYRWEKLLKVRARTEWFRYAAFELVSKGICPTARNRRQYEVPKGIRLLPQEEGE